MYMDMSIGEMPVKVKKKTFFLQMSARSANRIKGLRQG
jgi:hypothetical protein